MPSKNNNSTRFMPSADSEQSSDQEPNLLSDEPETASALTEPEPVETADSGGGEKLPKSSSGAGKWVVIVLLVLALGGLGYWYYYKTKQNSAELAAKQTQIADLQASKDKLAADLKKAQDSATASNSSDYQISELKISFKPSPTLTGLVYAYDQKGKVAAFTTRDISYKLEASAESPNPYKLTSGTLGLVYVLEDSGASDKTCKVTIKKLGSRTICYTPPQQVGTDDAKVKDQVIKAVDTLQKDLQASAQATK